MGSDVKKKKLKTKIYRKLKTTHTKTVTDAKASLSPGIETHTHSPWVQETGWENYRYEANFNYRVSSHPSNHTHKKMAHWKERRTKKKKNILYLIGRVV